MEIIGIITFELLSTYVRIGVFITAILYYYNINGITDRTKSYDAFDAVVAIIKTIMTTPIMYINVSKTFSKRPKK